MSATEQTSAPSAEASALDEFLARIQGLPRAEADAILRELDPEFVQDLLARIAEARGIQKQVARIADAADLHWKPKTPEELHEFIKAEMGMHVPRKAVCKGHRAPFEFVSDSYFEIGNPDKMAVGNRGSGKSQNVGIVHACNLRTKPRHTGLTVGAIENQAKRVYSFQKAIVTKPSWERYVDPKKVKMGSTDSRLGANVSIATATLSGVNSPHPNLAHIDEIELLRPGVYEEAMNMAQTTTVVLDDGTVVTYRAQNLLTSSWKKPTGLVSERMREYEDSLRTGNEAEYEIYRWCAWETTAPCAADCEACPFANVVKGEWADGTPRSFESACKQGSPEPDVGKLKFTDGFIAVDDTVRRFRRLSKRVWESQQESKRPSLEGLVYEIFDEDLYTVDWWEPDPAHGSIDVGLDFGGSVPFAATFWQHLDHAVVHTSSDGFTTRVLPAGSDVCFDEVYEEDISTVTFGKLVNATVEKWRRAYPGFSVDRFYADPAAHSDRRQLSTLSELVGAAAPGEEHLFNNVPTVARGRLAVDSSIALIIEMMGNGEVWYDRMRCENTMNELGGYEWKRPGVPEKSDDHAMDSMRYRFANRYAARLGLKGAGNEMGEAPRTHRRLRAVTGDGRTGSLEWDPAALGAAHGSSRIPSPEEQMGAVVGFSRRRRVEP